MSKHEILSKVDEILFDLSPAEQKELLEEVIPELEEKLESAKDELFQED